MSGERHRHDDDVAIIRRALDGSQEAYREIVVRYQRPVLALIRRMVRDPVLAEDLAQEVFLKAFRALGSFERSRKFSSWLFKIAHNTAIDHLRRRELETTALEAPDTESQNLIAVLSDPAAEMPDKRAERRDLAMALEEAVAQLRVEYREVMLLRYQQGLSYEEIADISELPVGTVKTHLFRARKAMAKYLSDRGWGAEE